MCAYKGTYGCPVARNGKICGRVWVRPGCGCEPGTGVRRKSNKPMENKFQALYFGCKTPGESAEKLFCEMFFRNYFQKMHIWGRRINLH